MYSQTIQLLRGEVEAVSTLHTALARLAQYADARAPSAWSGPLLDEIEDAADEDGSYTRAAVDDLRRRSANALANQYRVAAATIESLKNGRQAELKSLLGSTLATGTGSATILQDPNPAGVLSSLVRSGELRLDYAQRAVQVVKSATEVPAPAEKPAKKPVKKVAAKAKKPAKKVATKAKPAAKKKPAKVQAKKAPAKKPAAKAKPAGKKSPSKRR